MHNTSEAGLFPGLLRDIYYMFDWCVFGLLTTVYQVFFLVATNEIIKAATVKVFFSRIQLIIGVIMLFKLAFTLINGIVNPEAMTDKEKGFEKIITRIITALAILVAVIPLNIPNPSNAWDESLNDNGILFGTLYTAQNLILENNTVAKIILGTTEKTDDTSKNFQTAAGDLAVTILKAFISPNLSASGVDNEPANYWCSDDSKSDNPLTPMDKYETAQYPEDVLELRHAYCTPTVNNDGNKKRYVFDYMGFISTIVGGIVCFLFIGYTLDVAIRALKLVVLRLLAPVAAISYISPKSSKDGIFASWTKSLISTYLSLFMRLAIVYFTVFITQQIAANKPTLFPDKSFAGVMAFIFTILGVLFFAKQAPKFLEDSLGLKGLGGSVGLSGMLGGTAALLGGGGLSGAKLGAMQGSTAANQAAAEGKQFSSGQAWAQNRDQMAQIRTGDKDARGGIIGGMMDRQLYKTRERQLAKKGLSDDAVNKAKSAYHDQQDVVSAAENEQKLAFEDLKNAKRGIGIDMSDYKYAGTGRFKNEDAKSAYEKEKNLRISNAQQAYDNSTKKLASEQKILGKQQSNYENMSDARKVNGVEPRTIDEYSSGRKSYRAGGNRTKAIPDIRESDITPSTAIDDTSRGTQFPEIGSSQDPDRH